MKAMAGKPVLFSYLEPFWTAFQRLDSCREQGPTQVGRIPWSAMDMYCTRYFYRGEQYEEFIDIMESLDQAFLAQLPKPARPGSKNRGK